MAVFGCIADDFTGASDAASFLVKGGMRVCLYNGIPDENLQDDAQAIVIALKSRTQPTAQAVEDSLAAARYLLAQGVQQIYFKYCSTFQEAVKRTQHNFCHIPTKCTEPEHNQEETLTKSKLMDILQSNKIIKNNKLIKDKGSLGNSLKLSNVMRHN